MQITTNCIAQVSVPGFPTSFLLENQNNEIPNYSIPFLNNQELIDSDTCKGCKLNFAIDVDLEIDFFQNSLKNIIIFEEEEFEIFRLKLVSPSAYALNVIFSHFNLQEDSKLFIYNPYDTSDFLGAFSELNNKTNGIFVSGRLWSNQIVLELNRKKRNIEVENETLIISGLTHVYKHRNEFGIALDCHENVICAPWYNEWCNEIRSVVKFEYTKNGIRTWSSAVLLNNTNNDFDPLILTAHHSIDGIDDLNTVLFYFNFQSNTCNPSNNGNDRMFITGADVLDFESSTFGCPDIAILRAHEQVPLQYNAFYSGWNRRAYSSLPNDNIAVGIHHPAGDLKKFSQGTRNNPLLSSCIKVNWNTGYAEEGSSGSPLFVSSREVVGVLSWNWHVEDDCEDDANWFYSKMSESWSELQPHLATNNASALTHNGIDPISSCQPIINLNGRFFPGNDWQVQNQIIIQANNVVNIANTAGTSIEWSEYFNHNFNSDYIIRAGDRITINPGFRINAPFRAPGSGIYNFGFFPQGNQNRVSFQITPCVPFIDNCGFNHTPAMVLEDNELKHQELEWNNLPNIPSIHPNPNSGLFNITFEYEINGKVLVNVVDITGREILAQKLPSNPQNSSIDLSQANSGIYFVTIIQNGIKTTHKVIVNKD